MNATFRTVLRVVATVGTVAGYAVLTHLATSAWAGTDLGTAIAIAPLLLVAGLMALRAPRRPLALAGLTLLLGALAWVWPWLRLRVDWMSFLPHLSTNTFLAWYFGRTLLAGETPLITRIAQTLHGSLDPFMARYTRQVTRAWTLFFIAMASISAVLFASLPAAEWSVFANLLTAPLVALMFAAEYAVRLCVVPAESRTGIIESIRAYSAHSSHNAPPPAR